MHRLVEGKEQLPNCDGERHHYVPQFVLSKFKGKGRLYVLDKETGTCEETTPKEAAWHKDLYKVQSTTGNHDGIVEAFFALSENYAALALDALLRDPKHLSDRDRGDLAFLIAIQEQRAPGFLAEQKENITYAGMTSLAVDLANWKGPKSKRREARETHEALTQGHIRIEPPDQEVLIISLQALAVISHTVNTMPWTLLQAKEGAFVSSDRPLTMYDPEPKFPWSAPGWISSERVEATLPLTKAYCVRVGPGQRQRLGLQPTAKQVERVNLRTYGWATRYLFGPSPDLLERLHATATTDPDSVPKFIPKRMVMTEDAETADPAIAERNVARGWPRYIGHEEPDGTQCLLSYEVIESEDDVRKSVAPRGPATPASAIS
jgi:hypothetical protein